MLLAPAPSPCSAVCGPLSASACGLQRGCTCQLTTILPVLGGGETPVALPCSWLGAEHLAEKGTRDSGSDGPHSRVTG